MSDYRSLINKAFSLYELAMEKIDRGDFLDACEKAWRAVEFMRKAMLVKVGISYDVAKTAQYGIPIFTRLIYKLKRKDLLEKYSLFNYKLHVMGFYEGATEDWEVRELIEKDVYEWLNEMRNLIESIDIDVSKAEEIIKEIEKRKRKMISESASIATLREQLNALIEKALSK